MDIKKILDQIQVARNTCEYWDVRVESVDKTDIRFENFELINCASRPSLGAFVRVYDSGKWFYTATTDITNLSQHILRLSDQAKKYVSPANQKTIRPYNVEAFEQDLIQSERTRVDQISIKSKKELCESYFDTLREFDDLTQVVVMYSDQYKLKYFTSSTGVKFSQDYNHAGVSISYSVVDANNKFDDKVNFYGMNFDDLKLSPEDLNLRIQESRLFVGARTIEGGHYPVIMDSEVVGVFAHESFGHKSEADFMLGDEEAKKLWKIGERVASDCLTIVDSGEEFGTSGYCPIDDEGFKTQKTYLIKDGFLAGRLHSQQTSQFFEEAPTGNGRAMNFEFEPIVRMTNTYVEAGEDSFDDLVARVKLGIYVKDFKHGSGLSTFTIAPRKSYMIRDGKLAEPVLASVISGTVFETLKQIEACSKDYRLSSSAFGGCGKGEQWPLSVGFGGPQILVNDMSVS